MKWTVYCVKQAGDDLADIWLNAVDRQSITNAADAVEAELRRAPESAGESRFGNRRILFCSPGRDIWFWSGQSARFDSRHSRFHFLWALRLSASRSAALFKGLGFDRLFIDWLSGIASAGG